MKTVKLKTLLFLIFSTTLIFGQGTADRLIKIKDRILIVELPLKSSEYIKELTKSNKTNEILEYENRCNYIRESIKTTMTKFWNYNSKIVFVNSDSIVPYINGKTNLFAIMRYGNKDRLKYEKFKNNYIMAYDRPRVFSLFLANEEPEVLFTITPLKAALGEFIISIQSFNSAIKVYLSHPNIKQTNVNSYTISKEDKPRFDAKNQITLIKKEDLLNVLKQDNYSEGDIEKVYPYKFKIVNNNEWESALLNKDKNYACLTAYYFPVSNNVCEVVDSYSSVNQKKQCDEEGGMSLQIFMLHVASDCNAQGGDAGKKIEKIMGAVKKQLNDLEEKAKKYEMTPH